MSTERVDLVCVNRTRSVRNWEITHQDQRVIQVGNAPLLKAALRNGMSELGKDIRRVIFDQSSDAASFLQFLSELPVDFRGDVLAIQADGRAFLSAPAARGDGRVLYSLRTEDLDFYLTTAYSRRVEANVTESTHYQLHGVAIDGFHPAAGGM